VDKVARPVQESPLIISEIPRDLFHPLAIRSRKDPGNLDPPGLEINDEEYEIPNQSRASDHFDTEEVGCRNRTPVSLQERLPRLPLPPDRVESVFEQDPFDRISTDLVSQVVERSSDSGVAPARVVASHSEDQLSNFSCSSRATRASALTPVILFRDQLSVPSEQRIRGHQSLYLEEPSSADLLGLYREPSTLRIGEAEPLLAELLPQGSVTRKLRFLLSGIFDHVLLVSIDPASEDQHQKLQRQSVHLPESRPPNLGEMRRNRRSGTRLSI